MFAAGESLEVVGRAGVGLDNIDVDAATGRGIAVMNAPAGNTVSTAELAFALLLSAARRIPAADRSLREGRWDRKAFRGAQLAGKTLGVIGAGRIGAAVIQRARAFGMKVVVADPYMTAERARDLYVDLMDLDDMLPVVDFVTLHVPLTVETTGLLDADRIGLLQPHAVLVNASRGGIVDEDALAAALREGRWPRRRSMCTRLNPCRPSIHCRGSSESRVDAAPGCGDPRRATGSGDRDRGGGKGRPAGAGLQRGGEHAAVRPGRPRPPATVSTWQSGWARCSEKWCRAESQR